ncbi:ribosomal protein L30 [Pneumocystis murina B123]|uniref:Large ribosomal subunit protein uL30m n=1 Tax=Pneumocystis murina (strain B123) TaxID=1069680 RepID=M7NWK6_PNEMU|nr:ribosomal protein L30 [Pneumocystis murina B123]EMR11536.1 ribosomal protein L30 [Pneumocystis murina B123]
MGYFKITLQRSSIGLPKNIKRTLLSLGLRKRLSTVYHSISPVTAGKILKVKELVSVEEVDKRLTSIEMKRLRRPDKGYYVES